MAKQQLPEKNLTPHKVPREPQTFRQGAWFRWLTCQMYVIFSQNIHTNVNVKMDQKQIIFLLPFVVFSRFSNSSPLLPSYFYIDKNL